MSHVTNETLACSCGGTAKLTMYSKQRCSLSYECPDCNKKYSLNTINYEQEPHYISNTDTHTYYVLISRTGGMNLYYTEESIVGVGWTSSFGEAKRFYGLNSALHQIKRSDKMDAKMIFAAKCLTILCNELN